MKQNYFHDQRGVAMLLELVLVAAVLSLAGLAVYQANNHPKTVAAVQSAPAAPSSAGGLATSAATTAVQDSANDASLSASAEGATTELSQTDTDVSNLGGTSNASF